MGAGLVDGAETVFVPVSLELLRSLATSGQLPGPVTAYGVTADLLTWGEFGPDELEDAIFTAQSLAATAALVGLGGAPGGRRVVLAVAGTGFVPAADALPGEGSLPGLRWRQVQAVFSDDPDVDLTVAGTAAAGLTVAQAWDDPVVADFVEENDLGWFTPDEARHW